MIKKSRERKKNQVIAGVYSNKFNLQKSVSLSALRRSNLTDSYIPTFSDLFYIIVFKK